MKIAIDLTSLSWHLTGIERYAMCITDKMIDTDKENTYYLIFRNEVFPLFKDRVDSKRIKAIVLKGDNKLLFLQIKLLRALRKTGADKYLFFAFPSPILFKNEGIINTIHDMGAWDSAEEMATLSKYYFRASYRNAAKVSKTIITVSEFSKRRIHEILGIREERIKVIYSAVYEDILQGEVAPFTEVKEEYNLPHKYIMTLSTLEPRKNMKILLEAFDQIADRVDYDLVLVGRKGWKMDDVLEQYRAKDRIHITGFVKDKYLSAIYKNAYCFVFPSLYEGFGLPPVEALALGTPVISSDAASLPEVLMNQAVYFHNNSIDELSSILLNLENNVASMPHVLNEEQIQNYSFNIAASKVLDLLKIGNQK